MEGQKHFQIRPHHSRELDYAYSQYRQALDLYPDNPIFAKQIATQRITESYIKDANIIADEVANFVPESLFADYVGLAGEGKHNYAQGLTATVLTFLDLADNIPVKISPEPDSICAGCTLPRHCTRINEDVITEENDYVTRLTKVAKTLPEPNWHLVRSDDGFERVNTDARTLKQIFETQYQEYKQYLTEIDQTL